jgi:hypothetical protein
VWGVVTLVSGALLFLLAVSAVRVVTAEKARTIRPVHFLLFGYLLLIWSCWALPGYLFPLTQIELKLAEDSLGIETPLRVSYHGSPVLSLDRAANSSFEIRGHLKGDALRVEMLAPAGWAPVEVHDYFLSVELRDIPTATLYVDNHGHEAVLLNCGQLALPIAADEASPHVIFRPRGADAAPVSIDGQVVGRLSSECVLIDVQGSRAYRWRQITYTDPVAGIMRLGPEPVLPPEEPVKTFGGKQLYTLPGKIDFFLTAAPERVSVKRYGYELPGMGAPEQRTELLAVEPSRLPDERQP